MTLFSVLLLGFCQAFLKDDAKSIQPIEEKFLTVIVKMGEEQKKILTDFVDKAISPEASMAAKVARWCDRGGVEFCSACILRCLAA